MVLAYDFTRSTVVEPPAFASIDPSFAPVLFDDPGVPIYALLDGTTVRVEIVALDAGTSLTVNGSKLAHPGDRKKIGDMPDLHNHVTWGLDVPAGVVGDFHMSFMIVASGTYADSPVYTITITNRPNVTTTTTPTTTSSTTTSTATVSTTSTTTSITTTSITTTTTTSITTTTTLATGVDAHLCYRAPLAKGEPPFDVQRRTLSDRFGAGDADVRDVWGACNPAEVGGAALAHPDVGRERLTLKPVKEAQAFAKRRQTVTDAFGGSYELELVKPERLLVPGGMAQAGSSVVIPPDADERHPGRGAPPRSATGRSWRRAPRSRCRRSGCGARSLRDGDARPDQTDRARAYRSMPAAIRPRRVRPSSSSAGAPSC